MNWLTKATLTKHAYSLKSRTSGHEIQMRTTDDHGRRAVDISLSLGNQVCVGNPTTDHETIPVKTAARVARYKTDIFIQLSRSESFCDVSYFFVKEKHGEQTRKALNNK